MKKRKICILMALEAVVLSFCACSYVEEDISKYIADIIEKSSLPASEYTEDISNSITDMIEDTTLPAFNHTESDNDKLEESNSKLFSRALERSIPDGYIESKWKDEDETPIEVLQEYTMIANPNTNMIGLCDYNGNILIDANYSELSFCALINDIPYFFAIYEGKWGVVNGEGTVTIPFDADYYKKSPKSPEILENNVLQFIRTDQGATCIILDITQGEIGRFDIYTEVPGDTSLSVIATETILGPNNWVFPVTYNDKRYELGSMGIVDYAGNTLTNKEIYCLGMGDRRSQSATSDGYSYQPIAYWKTSKVADYEYYILDSNANIVSGPYISVTRYDDVFSCVNASHSRTVFDPAKNQSYNADALDGGKIAGILEKNIVLYGNSEGIFTLELSSGNVSQIRQDLPEKYGEIDSFDGEPIHYLSIYGKTFVYMSNDTYKISDLEGNTVGDERYYGFQDTGYGALLKQENGDWVYLNEEGHLSENNSIFHGEGEKASTYNNCAIIGYWKYNDIPCVVVEEGANQVGYAL